MTRAWYLGIGPEDIAPRCILVGDPGRVSLFAARLEDARLVNDDRGLRTVTGRFEGVPVTISAFGMGAPIAVVVLEELASLGARVVLRAGTAMSLHPSLPMSHFVVGLAGMRAEGTSLSYAPISYPAVADWHLTRELTRQLDEAGVPHKVGIIASDDGFYTHLFAAAPEREATVTGRLEELCELGVLAADMETAALLVAGGVLGVRAGSLCLVSVDAATRRRLSSDEMAAGERALAEVALRTVVAADGEL